MSSQIPRDIDSRKTYVLGPPDLSGEELLVLLGFASLALLRGGRVRIRCRGRRSEGPLKIPERYVDFLAGVGKGLAVGAWSERREVRGKADLGRRRRGGVVQGRGKGVEREATARGGMEKMRAAGEERAARSVRTGRSRQQDRKCGPRELASRRPHLPPTLSAQASDKERRKSTRNTRLWGYLSNDDSRRKEVE